ncbi:MULTISPECIES: aminoglycoside phosphotransferase family protein [Streptomyces]|uniref:aminoglycoside phosphotransferase family protein n=1 Tax=Streptomyces TaxID=1883 RepID=UPI00163BD635|nr:MULTISPECIES: aminoglycoside phosphotransferase family protein [Streptomyces]MBC2873793.1 hydroxyurea phosphotransferase [Streptomyces sp. TYQ1024]UBI37784.1 aminoglycoside phosphotransferase family protein [Streptomyces mobaraensis]UKW30372.1 aminoglycoside phosphotransferase family protein [Streptomyces sp. TYQ1024]
MSTPPPITVPPQLAEHHEEHNPEHAAEWIAGLPGLAADFLDRWNLRPDGEPAHGYVALVLPVRREDGTPAALKLQPVDEERAGEPLALRAWSGRGAVRLLEDDPATGTLLLERLDPARSLDDEPDAEAALLTLTGLLARLHTAPAPAGLRHLGDVTREMLAAVPAALPALENEEERAWLAGCAEAVREVATEPGDRLLHWDLHYENVLAPLPGSPAADRGPWLAIDPVPLVGDPCFDLMPAFDNRWEDLVATGDVERAVRRRFDLMTDVLSLDRGRAARWTMARALQNSLWDVEDGSVRLQEEQMAVVRAVGRYV